MSAAEQHLLPPDWIEARRFTDMGELAQLEIVDAWFKKQPADSQDEIIVDVLCKNLEIVIEQWRCGGLPYQLRIAINEYIAKLMEQRGLNKEWVL